MADSLGDSGKFIELGGIKISYIVAGIVVLAVLIGIGLQFHLTPTKVGGNGLKNLDLEIFKQIGSGLQVTSKQQAVSNIGSIAQDLEKARGTLRSINEGLDSD
ncbi:MAG: hypothetical protein HYW50_01765 [Candidatus Diapherotrites archaeon]|nr:hypothetical protein [Candidatus Diapherotrites archaeon]